MAKYHLSFCDDREQVFNSIEVELDGIDDAISYAQQEMQIYNTPGYSTDIYEIPEGGTFDDVDEPTECVTYEKLNRDRERVDKIYFHSSSMEVSFVNDHDTLVLYRQDFAGLTEDKARDELERLGLGDFAIDDVIYKMLHENWIE